MNTMSKTASILVVVLLLIGAAAIAIVKTRDSGEESAGEDGGGHSVAAVKPGAGGGSGGTGMGAKAINRSEREIRNEELVEKYGSTRTNLSRQVSENVVSLLDDAVAMGEMMTQGGGFGGGRMMMRGMQRRAGVELTEEQQTQAMEIYKAYQQREMEKFKGTVDDLRKDPSVLMELFLAGDAKARNEMTDEEYAEVQAEAGARLGEVINPLDEKNFRPGNPMEDEAFRQQFEAILDDEQAATLNAKMAEREAERAAAASEEPEAPAAAEEEVPNSSIANMQTMELEKLDEAVGSAKQMTSGLKQMMEGFGNLRQMRGEGGNE